MEDIIASIEDLELRATEILMDTSLSVIVEGDNDIKIYENLMNEECFHFEQFHGKENLLQVIDYVNHIDSSRAIAIIDKDLDDLLLRNHPKNVFQTDAHDIDTQMFMSDAFLRVAREVYSRSKARTKKDFYSIRDELISLARPIAHIRLLSEEKKYGFAFKPGRNHPKEFPYKSLVIMEKNQFRGCDMKTYIRVVCCYRNQGAKMDQNKLEADTKEIEKRAIADEALLHGHDLMAFMGLSVKKYGRDKASAQEGAVMEAAFRLTYKKEFQSTSLYQSLKAYSNQTGIPIVQ